MDPHAIALVVDVPPLCGLAAAAALIRVSPDTLRHWLQAQLLPRTQLSGRYVMEPTAVLAPFHQLPRGR